MKNYFRFVRILLPAALILGAGCAGSPDQHNENRRPNVIFILGDDMKLDHFGFINGQALTPHLDRLAREGFFFSRTYVPSAACTPTRFSCLTGRFGSRCQSPDFIHSATPEGVYRVEWNTDLLHEPDILSRTLQEAGYKTGIVGKWHNGSPPGFGRTKQTIDYEADPADPEVAGKLEQLHRLMQQQMKELGFDYADGLVSGNYHDNPLKALAYHNQEDITQKAVEFIRQYRETPFFLYIPTTLMHGPSPWKSLNSSPLTTWTGLLDKPIDIQPSRESVIERGRAAGIEESHIGATWLDDGIGVILRTLKELGLEKNTMVVFMDDQGMDGGKASCYEGGVRVPSMIWWPGKIKPGSSEALVANIDLYPTICEACSVMIDTSNHDGTSLWPILKGEEEKVRDHIYCEWSYSRAIVTDRWKYLAFRIPPSRSDPEERLEFLMRYAESKNKRHEPYSPRPDEPLSHMGYYGGQGTERNQAMKHYPHYYDPDQLYYLPDDPGEQVNLAGNPEYAEKLDQMKGILSEWVEKMPGTFGEF